MRLAAAMAAASRKYDGTSEFHHALFHVMVMMVVLSVHIMFIARPTNSYRSEANQVTINTRSLDDQAKCAAWRLGTLRV